MSFLFLKFIRSKRFVAFVASVLLSALAMSGCAQDVDAAVEDERAAISEQDVLEYYQSIISFPRSGPMYPSMIDDYLIEQAALIGLDAVKDEEGNVIMRSPATAGMEGARPTVLLAYTGADIVNDRSEAFDPYADGVSLIPSDDTVRADGTSMGAKGALGAATVLAVLKSAQAHGEITAYFAAGDGAVREQDADASQYLPAGPSGEATSGSGGESDAGPGGKPAAQESIFPEDAAIIEIGGTDTGGIVSGAPAAALLGAYTTTGAVEAGNGKAYVIAASGFPAGSARAGNGDEYMSPVSAIAKVLSDAKSAGCVYGLYSFSGGTDACTLPTEAQATVILGDYETREFRRIFNSVAEEALDQTPGADIRMIETVRPATVTDEDAVSKALAYVFGLMNLSYSDSDGSVNIGRISLSPDAFDCGVAVSGYDVWDIEQLVNAQSAFERISGVPVERIGDIPGFGGDEAADEVSARLEKAYAEASGEDARPKVSDSLSPLGKYAENITVRGLSVPIQDEGTTNEHFAKSDAAASANAILRYLEGS